ncbi:phage tail tape measure protein [Clostridium cellulovorans]|uniref:Phage tail tape measure protein, TP901 family n=1 Tax=Clostridium cellulovorans (strain ATCC 35296 / DSM 3052 / OCM 3 / 743B) TaxID=573061 RepID=D9SVZ8_CLOC7|nr:phage tail tape measure protein [Clostridium cellulovorans]ADL53209.1 phage tail tape measure protein, TP901 family [Clostridium cellulovorans 743B]
MSDGRIIIETQLDNKGLEYGVKKLSSTAKTGLKSFSDAFSDAEVAVSDLSESANKLDKNYSKAMNEVTSNTDKAIKKVQDLSEKTEKVGALKSISNVGMIGLAGAATAAGAAVLGLSGYTVKLGNDYSSAMNQLQASTGASAEEMKNLSEVVKGVYADNLGESFEDVANAVSEVSKNLSLSGDELKKITELAIGFRDTFGVEVNESARAAKALMDNFGISAEQAFNLMTQGQQQGLDFSGEFIDTINEYSVQFKKLGLSAEDMFKVFYDGTASGAFNLDKVGDAIKELSIRVVDGSKTTIDGFNLIGLNADEMAKKFASGGESAREAFYQTLQALNSVQDPLAKNTAGVDLLGTMWEDLGPEVVTSLGTMTDTFNMTLDSAQQLNNIKYNSFGEALQGLKRQLETNVLLPISEKALPALNDMANKLKESFSSEEMKASLKTLSESISKVIEKVADFIANNLPSILDGLAWILDNADIIAASIAGIGTALGTMKVAGAIMELVDAFKGVKIAINAATVAEGELNVTMMANPIILIVSLIAGLIVALVVLWNTNEDFRNAVTAIWEKVSTFFKDVWNGIVKFFTETIPKWIDDVVEWFESIPEWFKSLPGKIETWLKDVIVRLLKWAKDVNDQFVNFVIDTLNGIIDWFESLPEKIGYLIGFTLGKLLKFGQDTYNWVTTEIPKIIDEIINWFKTLPDRIWEWLTNTINDFVTWCTDMNLKAEEYMGNLINDIVNWFTSLPGRIWEWLTNTVNDFVNWCIDMNLKAEQYVGDLINNIIDWFKALPDRLVEVGENIVYGIYDGIMGAKDWLFDKIGEFVDGVLSGFTDALDINSPSRVMRDLVGINIVKGIGVGIDVERPNLEKDIGSSIDGITSKMQTAVNLETAKTTANIVANNTIVSKDSVSSDALKGENKIIENHIHVDIEGREVAKAVAPFQNEFDNYNLGR